jgi:nicotinate-nucleotide adenylyltransferase
MSSERGAAGQPDRNARTGIYGGTFNPIHLGHLRVAEELVELLDLEEMVFVPAATPPHKRSDEGQDAIAPARDRLAWVELAIAGNPRFRADPIELGRDGPSYTVDTLRALAAQNPGNLPVFAIGRDAFVEMGTWREPEAILTLAHLAVTTRPPVGEDTLADWLPDCLHEVVDLAADGRSGRHRDAGTWIRQIEVTALDISASAIRERARKGQSIRYLVPEAVWSTIANSGAYVSRRASGRAS